MLENFFKIFKKVPETSIELATLKQVINFLPGHVYWYAKNGVFYGCNDQQAKAFGFEKSEDLIGRNLYDMLTPQEAEDHKKVNESVFKSGKMQIVEEATETYYGGKKQIFLSQKLPWRDEKGKILGIIGISFDITERKKYERELLIYAQIINSLPEHVYWKDSKGVYLGSNLQQAQDLGFLGSAELIGKTDYDISAKAIADFIRKIDAEVIETGKTLTKEEPLVLKGKLYTMLSKKVPLKDENGKIIGVLGISFDITEEKNLKVELERAKNLAENTLRNIIEVLPGHVYWYNREGIFLGCNDQQAESAGYTCADELIGKSAYEIQTPENAKILREINENIFRTGQPKSTEEPYLYKDGKKAIFLSKKTPLRDEHGQIIGIIGISFDITDRKEKERLEIEREVNNKTLEAREKYKHTAEKAAHDIRSPLAGLAMIIERLNAKAMPEKDRLDIKDALHEIDVIATDLVDYDKIEANPEAYKKEKPQAVLVSATLSQLLSIKKSEYKNLSITLEAEINEKAYVAFINIEPTALKRALSNIINNARDAFDGKEGEITLKLETTKTQVKIIIEDNGKGMSQDIIKKIMNKTPVTSNKAEGHGFGMSQVLDTLEHNQGTLSIDSKVGRGTKIILTFPRIKAPEWFAEELTLGTQDLIIVLDDDGTMHNGWDAHFKDILAQYPGIRLEHFFEGEEAVNFINNASIEDKQKVFLLTDYELLEQPLNGLDVIEKTAIKRSLLVTSHYAKSELQERAIILGTKIVPKQSAANIPIKVDEKFKYTVTKKAENKPLKKVDVIVIDDNQKFAEQLKMHFAAFDKIAECYYDPRKFLKEIGQYPKDTRICIDNNFEGGVGMSGVEVGEKLHALGYNKLYLFSGDMFQPGELPDYLTAVLKGDADFVDKIFN